MTMIMTMMILMRVAMPEAAEINPSTMIVETSGEDNILGSLSTRVFETRTATGREHFACQDSGVSQIFIRIISNGE